MVNLDWKRILSIKHENFTEEEKEDLLEQVVTYAPTSDVSKKQLTALLKVAQEILKFKTEQADSLLTAVDELAVKKGEDEAKNNQELLDEIESLHAQLEYQKKLDRESGFSDDEMKLELERLEMQNEELALEMQEQEKELMAEKAEVERLTDQVTRLERDRVEITRELEACREESVPDHRRDSGSIGGSSEKIEELMDLVRQKNKHLMQLLDDVATLESTNSSLQQKLALVEAQLVESNSTITDRSNKISKLSVHLSDVEAKNKELRDCNKALTDQIDELIRKREKNEQDLDDFALKLNERVDEWKCLLDNKDKEVVKLKEDLLLVAGKGLSVSATSSINFRLHNQHLSEENTKLKEQIKELLTEKDNQLIAIQELRSELVRKDSDKEEKNRQILEHRVKELEEQLGSMMAELERKCEEISELLSQLRAYEQGEFGLSDALVKIKNLEKKISDKNFQIEKLVAFSNQMDETSEKNENTASPCHVKDTASANNISVSMIRDLRNQIEKLNSEIIELKMENRKLLKKQVIPETPIPLDMPKKESEFELKYHLLLEENDSLRKGLHDILNSIKNESMGEIQVTSLERLLEAMDARHISGWYHPAMRLQAHLNTVQGEANELRNRIRLLTKENQRLERENGANSLPTITQNQSDEAPEKLKGNEEGEEVSDGLVSAQGTRDITRLEQERFEFEQASASWAKEKRSLHREREELREKLVELGRGDFETLPDNNMSAREEELERELDRVRRQWYQTREKLLKENIDLKTERTKLYSNLNRIQKEMNLSTSPDHVTELEKELSFLRLELNSYVSRKTLNATSDMNFSQLNQQIEMLQEIIQISTNNPQINEQIETVLATLKRASEELQSNSHGDNVDLNEKLKDLLEIESKMKSESITIFRREIALKDQLEQTQAEISRLREFLKMYQSLYRSVMVDRLGENNDEVQDMEEVKIIQLMEPINEEPSAADVLYKQVQILYNHIGHLHANYQNALCFPNLQMARDAMAKIERKVVDADSYLKKVEEREQAIASKEEELDVQLRTVHEMKCAMQTAGASTLITWHNKVTEFDLIEARYKRKNMQLQEQVKGLELQVRECNQALASLECETLDKERKWTKMQREWADAQIEIFKLVHEKQVHLKEDIHNEGEIAELEQQLRQFQMQNKELVDELKQKDVVFAQILASQAQAQPRNDSPTIRQDTKHLATKSSNDEQEKGVVHSSLASLRAIIQQKEEQIENYQSLLRTSHEEKDEAMRRMEKDLRNVHAMLAQQSKAYSRIKLGINKPGKGIIEKYLKKIQELEEELGEAQGSIKKYSKMLEESNEEAEHWRRAVVEQERSSEETRERMEIQLEHLQEELSKSHQDAEKWRDMAHGDQVLLNKINELQAQLLQQPKQTNYSGKEGSDTMTSQLRFCREENARLRKQIAAISTPKRKPPTNRSPGQQENLIDKIRKLEETLQLSKKHEQELEENGIKRIRSVEEVTRWDERKKHQKSLDKLNAALKQKEVEAEVANKKLETLKGLMTKVEREKHQLESQFKALTGTHSARERSGISKIIEEKLQLQEQINSLENELKALNRNGMDETRRNSNEMDFFENEIAILKKHNFALDKENLALKVQLEKLQIEIRKNDIQKSSRQSTRNAYEMQRALNKAKDEIRQLIHERTVISDQNIALREQLQKIQAKLQLWEDKDVADTIAKTKQEKYISHIIQELNHTKGELSRKSHLLGRVKVLLCRAAAKEKALNEKVSALQSKQSS